MKYTKNKFGLKNSSTTYLNIKGKYYEQWTDFKTKEQCEAESPKDNFISRQKDDFIRIYRELK